MAGRTLPTKQATHKIGEYSLIPKFLGYKAREDDTILPIGTMVSPSQNVLLKTTGRISLVPGYVLDGAGSTVIDSGILSNFDFIPTVGATRNLRAGFLTSAGNDGKLQYRYLDAGGTVNWVNLKTGLTNVRLSYCSYWDNTALVNDVLWVDGSNNIFRWNGAVTTLASATSNTVTKQGTETWAQMGFASYSLATIGSSSTQFDITNPSGTTFRYTWDTTGTDPAITATSVPVGSYILLAAQNFNAANNGLFVVTGSAANYFEVTNVSGVVESNKTIGSGHIYSNFTKLISIGGVVAGYTGGETTQTLTGVTVDFSSTGTYPIGSIIHQAVITIALSGMTSIPATFAPTLLGCGRNNQVYVGSSSSNVLYISKVNDYTNYAFTAAARIAGEGWTKVLDAPPVAFVSMESRTSEDQYDLYISQGKNNWGIITSTTSIAFNSSGVAQNTIETLQYIRLKSTSLQGAQSSKLVSKMKNHIVFVGFDNVANFFGWISFQYVPETVDFSYPIIDDMNSYDFTDGSIFYHKNFVYLALPKEGIIRVYNMTDQTKQTTLSAYHPFEDVDVANQPWYWEAPITYPVSGFYVTDDKGLCAHAYTTSESYQIFTGGNLNGQDITANATFCFDDKGDRTQSKGSNEIWVEGYISQNTNLSVSVIGDKDSFATSQTKVIRGNDRAIVAYGGGGHSLGERSLGSASLGGADVSSTLPAWFHTAQTYVQVPSYLEQVSFSTKGVDLNWELITFGTNATPTVEGNNAITE